MWLSSPPCDWGAAELSHNMFTRGSTWGLAHFMPLNDILDRNKGFLKDDNLEVCSSSGNICSHSHMQLANDLQYW